MSSCITLRHVRNLCTAAASSSISISKVKAKLRSQFDPDKALKIYSSLSDHYTTSSPASSRYAQDLTVKRLAKSGRFTDIETLLESHKNDPKISQEAYLSSLIRSYGVAGMFDHAVKTFNQMDDFGTPRSTISFNALISACNQSKRFDLVPQLFDEIPQRHGFLPDKFSYGILVKSYCESNSPELAIDTLKRMEEKGIEISTVTFTTIFDWLYKNGKSDEAETIWNEMVMKGCSPDVAAYNVRIMHTHNGDPEIVKAMIEKIINAGLKPDSISYNYLVNCYCKIGKVDEAMKVYNRLEEYGSNPNAATYRTLVYYLCRNEEFEKGYKLFKESVKFHKIPDFNTLKLLVEGLVKKSKKKEAKGLCRTLRKKFPNSFSWRKVEEELGLAAAAPPLAPGEGETQEASR
ncbi:Pentatricopeptide repeat-containing protein [Camellia lanceoleosa]|uniref:Pentatricopeptide repeat-containing protein n=1 Tax=Camellia lanceoleosa TaxID=1840588 RepID=A0ACC0HYA3_9ERIC|nr:Pentatricopeptide repeat-containing protein [Camellia lanceoleosa]